MNDKIEFSIDEILVKPLFLSIDERMDYMVKSYNNWKKAINAFDLFLQQNIIYYNVK